MGTLKRASHGLFALALLLVLGSVAQAADAGKAAPKTDEDGDVREVAKFVLAHAPKLKGKRLAVMPFTYLDGSFSVEGRLLADLLHVELAKAGKLELLERERIANILEEHKLGKMGLLDAATVPQIGKIAGVNGFLFGHLVDVGHKLRLTARVVDTQSKRLGQKTFLLSKRIKTATTPLWEDIRKIKQKNKERFQIKVWTDKTTYRLGDKLVIRFKAGRSCYVTIFNMGSSGQITVLFPNRFYATNYVKKGEEYSIPGRFQNFTITCQGPPGLEKLKIFATDANVPLLPQQYNVSAFRSLDPKQRSVTRDLAVTLSNLDKTAWAEGAFEFQVKAAPKTKELKPDAKLP